jgi:hypothetical protein
MKQVKTVNVIEIVGDEIERIRSFPRTLKGETDAKEYFKEALKRQHFPPEDPAEIDSYAERGYWSRGIYSIEKVYSS